MATNYLARAFQVKEVRSKIIFTAFILAFYRFLAHIPVPNVDPTALRQFFDSSQFLSFLNVFTGGGLRNLSIVALGIQPYISASIIIQLLTMVVPSLEELSKEGLYGKQKINQYTQALTLPLAIIQAYVIYNLLGSQSLNGLNIIPNLNPFQLFVVIMSMTAGTFFLMWLGETITEYGVGNGASVIIFAGILAGIPTGLAGFLSATDTTQVFSIVIFALVAIGVIAGVVYINESYRRIQIQNSGKSGAGTVAQGSSFIPIKINQAGVIPIIFAVSLAIVPGTLGTYLQRSSNPRLLDIGTWMATNFGQESYYYNIFYFLLVFAFTYFYTSVTFNPQKIADDIRKRGGFIPGVRPGRATVEYLNYIILRLTLAGGLFLGLIAISPFIVQQLTGLTALAIGGTGLLIVVSVILQTVKQVESQLITREYEVFAK
jgi:preprotein translocase subunit SecY